MKKALVVIDMQNDFVDGSLGTDEAKQIVNNVTKKINEYNSEGQRVFLTQDTHEEDYLETLEGKKLPVEHCIHGTWGWELVDPIKEITKNSTIIEKPTFGSEELTRELKLYDPDLIEILGLCTDICVVSNALLLRAALPNTPINVISEACAGVTPQAHQDALNTMRSCQIDIK